MRVLLIAAVALLPATAQVGTEELAIAMKNAREARLRGDLSGSAEALDNALALSVSSYGEHSLEAAEVHSDLGAVQRALSQPDAALESYSRAVNLRARGKPDPVPQARDLTALALLYAATGHLDEAKPCLVQALEEWQKAGRDGPEILMTLETLAEIHRGSSEYAEAEPLYVRALRVREFAFGTESSELLGTVDSLAYVYFGLKRYAEAEPLYNRLIGLWEKSAGPDHPMIALTLEKMAEFLVVQERYEEAAPLVERAMAIRGRAHIASMHLRARLALMKGDKDEAASIVGRSISTAQSAGLPDEALVELMRVHSSFLRNSGHAAEALEYEARVKAVIFKGEARPAPKKSPEKIKPQ